LIPSTAIWVGVYVTLGVVAGIPVEHFLTKLARLAVQGAILLVIGVGGYLAIRQAPDRSQAPLVNMPGWVKTTLAALIDLGVVASVLTGLLALVRRLTGTGVTASWADAVVVLAAFAAIYLFVTRRSTGATLGEALLHATYLPRRAGTSVELAPSSTQIQDPGLQSAADLLHAVATVPRLAVLRTLLKQPSTSSEVAKSLGMAPNETTYHLAALGQVGLVGPDAGGQRFRILDPSRDWIAEVLARGGAQAAVPAPEAPPDTTKPS
jgi:DNA-binding transcriptional ArsR family regulator